VKLRVRKQDSLVNKILDGIDFVLLRVIGIKIDIATGGGRFPVPIRR